MKNLFALDAFKVFVFEFLNSENSPLDILSEEKLQEELESLEPYVLEENKRKRVRIQTFSEIKRKVLDLYHNNKRFMNYNFSTGDRVPVYYNSKFKTAYSYSNIFWVGNEIKISYMRDESFTRNIVISGFRLPLVETEEIVHSINYHNVLIYPINKLLQINNIDVPINEISFIFSNESLETFIIFTKNALILKRADGRVEKLEYSLFKTNYRYVEGFIRRKNILSTSTASVSHLLDDCLNQNYRDIRMFLKGKDKYLDKILFSNII